MYIKGLRVFIWVHNGLLWHFRVAAQFAGYLPKTRLAKPTVAIKGAEIVNAITQALNTYRDTAVTKFIIGERSFSGSALTTLRVPAQVTVIPEGAFNGCASLASVTLPDAVTVIGKQAFANCGKLEEMTTY